MNQQILVTRPSPQGEELCALLKKQSATAYHVPTLDIRPRAVSATLFQPDIAIFISTNAVKYCPLPTFPSAINYFAVGMSTSLALMERGVIAQQAESSNSEGLLSLVDLHNVTGKTIAIFAGVGGRMLLEEELKKRGAYCYRYDVYERHCAMQHASYLQTLLKTTQFDDVICTSGENLLCLEKMAGQEKEKLTHFPLVVVSQRIASLAKQRGFTRIRIFAEPFDNISMVNQLISWRKSHVGREN